MKVSKKLGLFIALLLVGITNINAQTKRENLSDEQKEEIKKNLEEYAAALNLSEEQKPKFEEITKKYAGQMKDLKNNGGSRMSKFRKMKSIRKNKDKEMKQLLHQEQFKVYLEKQEERKQEMKAKWRQR